MKFEGDGEAKKKAGMKMKIAETEENSDCESLSEWELKQHSRNKTFPYILPQKMWGDVENISTPHILWDNMYFKVYDNLFITLNKYIAFSEMTVSQLLNILQFWE